MIRVLLCEDDDLTARIVKRLLIEGDSNIEVTHCKDGLLAMELLKQNTFNIILSDQEMQVDGGDGKSLFKFTESHNITTPFIMHSTYPESHFEDLKDLPRFNYSVKYGKEIEGVNSIITLIHKLL
jgi:CheY-like chemotaxis protein